MIEKLIYHTLSSAEDIVFIKVTLYTGHTRYLNVKHIVRIDDEVNAGATILMSNNDYFQVQEFAEDIIRLIFSGCDSQ